MPSPSTKRRSAAPSRPHPCRGVAPSLNFGPSWSGLPSPVRSQTRAVDRLGTATRWCTWEAFPGAAHEVVRAPVFAALQQTPAYFTCVSICGGRWREPATTSARMMDTTCCAATETGMGYPASTPNCFSSPTSCRLSGRFRAHRSLRRRVGWVAQARWPRPARNLGQDLSSTDS
jgi:hypothetical protein